MKRLITRQTEFLGMNLFRDGIRLMSPFTITMLLVRRYRIMYLRLYTILQEIALQFVATFAEDGFRYGYLVTT